MVASVVPSRYGKLSNSASQLGDAKGDGSFLYLPPRQRELIQQAISGTATVFVNGLMSSGNFNGTVGTDDTLQFTVIFSSSGVSKIVGTISSQNTLSGTYTTTYPNGIFPNHQGTWEASPN